ncbi:MAG: GTPase Era [Lachnospiraceae bacterium]
MSDNFKSGFVGLIGRPNVGKSTLMNRMIGQKIAITSKKPQTTRNRIQTVYTDQTGQIVFVDTPGIQKAKNKLGEFMLKEANRSLGQVDVILWIVEASTFVGAAEKSILEKLRTVTVPVILIINKTDAVTPEIVMRAIDLYRTLYEFAEIIPTSALRGNNTTEIIETIFSYLPYGPRYFDEDAVTDQPMRQIAAEIIREKLLHVTEQEVPHGVVVVIDSMKERGKTGIVDIEATIICERDSHKGIIIGRQGSMLKKIGTNARYELEHMMEQKVNLKLWVKVKKDWRDSDYLIKNYGYKDSE